MMIRSRGLESAVIKKLSKTPSAGGAGADAGAEAEDEGATVEFAVPGEVFSLSSGKVVGAAG
jgi:hypothetical protein